MKSTILSSLILAVCFFTIACGGTAANTNADAKPNSNTATGGGSVKDQLVAIETKTHEALKNKDGEYVAKLLDPKFIGFFLGKPMDYAAAVEGWKSMPCTISTTSLSDWEVTELANEVQMLSYKSTADVKCPDKTVPSEVWGATLYVKQGADWKVYFHQNVTIPPKDAKPSDKAPAAGMKYERVEVSKLTDELMELEEDFWKTFQYNDPRILEERMAANAVHLAADGRIGKAELIKEAKDTACKLGDFEMMPFKSLMVGSDLAVLMYNAKSEATCDGDKASRESENTTVWKKVDGKWVAVYHIDGNLMN